jgi:hypothetical protein
VRRRFYFRSGKNAAVGPYELSLDRSAFQFWDVIDTLICPKTPFRNLHGPPKPRGDKANWEQRDYHKGE